MMKGPYAYSNAGEVKAKDVAEETKRRCCELCRYIRELNCLAVPKKLDVVKWSGPADGGRVVKE